MKYIVTVKDKTYEVVVEKGEAMITDEYNAVAPQPVVTSIAAASATTVQTQSPVPSTPTSTVDGNTVKSPLPGNVLSIKVSVGQKVKSGDVLLLIEAMKMENEVMATSDGVIKSINVSKGQAVATGDVLVVM